MALDTLRYAVTARDFAFEAILPESVLFEFMLKCRNGFGGRIFPSKDVEAFLSRFERLWRRSGRRNISAARVYTQEGVRRIDHIILEMLQSLPTNQHEELTKALSKYGILLEESVDPGDMHVLISAVLGHCDVIVTYNTGDFPRGGDLLIWDPGLFTKSIQSDKLQAQIVRERLSRGQASEQTP